MVSALGSRVGWAPARKERTPTLYNLVFASVLPFLLDFHIFPPNILSQQGGCDVVTYPNESAHSVSHNILFRQQQWFE